MAFPANNAATATVISSLPFSTADTFGGVAFGETWFVYTATATDLLVGLHIGSSDEGSGDNPTIDVYATIALDATVPGFCDTDQPIQTPLVAGTAYYLKVTGESGSATVTIDIQSQPNQALTSGDVLVPDPSTDDFPPVILSFASEGVVRVVDLPPADRVDRLADGTMLFAITPASGLVTQLGLYSGTPFGSLITTIANPLGTTNVIISNDHDASFYIAKRTTGGGNLGVRKIDGTTGAVAVTTWTISGATLNAFAVNSAGTRAYYSDNSADTPVKVWNLQTDSAAADLVAGIAGYKIIYLRTLADDSVVATYKKDADNSIRIIRYNSSGVSQGTFNAPAGDAWVGAVAEDWDDATRIVVRTENSALTNSTFWRLATADLSTITSFTVDNFDDGQGQNDTDQFFGPSEAADVMVLSASVSPSPEPVTTERYQIRCIRRSPHVSDTGQRLFHKRLQLDFEAGIGNTNDPGANPIAILRTSDDGGATWSNARTAPIGPKGAYRTRTQWWQNGMARDRVYEVEWSDPCVNWTLIQAWIDVEEGIG